MSRLTYRDAGVDIDAADRLVSRIAKIAASTRDSHVLSGVGLFSAAIKVPAGYREPVLMAATDGVGTKLAVAKLAGRHETIGIDLVAMNVNDLLTSGAKPLFFLDYLSVGRLASIDGDAIIKGIAEGCKRAGASLVGGETAEMPGFYPDGDYDLAGFAVGVVERRSMIDGSKIRPGDAVVGLESTGLHSNGYSLARKALGVANAANLRRRPKQLGETLGDALLRPTAIYVKPVLAALEKFQVRGMAHITGGGIPGNLVRVLPSGCRAEIESESLPEHPLLEFVRSEGGIEDQEMQKTFNGGIGYTMIVRPSDADALVSFLRRRRCKARVIGGIARGRRTVKYV